MYTLYGIDESGSCMIEIALQRCAVPWRRVDAASWADGEGSDELARINPLKQVPTLVTPRRPGAVGKRRDPDPPGPGVSRF